MTAINTTKLLILAILGCCALILGSAVLTLQLYVAQERRRLVGVGVAGAGAGRLKQPDHGRRRYIDSSSSSSSSSRESSHVATSTRDDIPTPTDTIRPSAPLKAHDLHLESSALYPPADGSSRKTVGYAYWRQAAAFLKEWDALLQDSREVIPDVGDYTRAAVSAASTATATATATATTKTTFVSTPRWALEQAAKAGHPMAQHYLANAYASGIWPVWNEQDAPEAESKSKSKSEAGFRSSAHDRPSAQLHVLEDWAPSEGHHPKDAPQLTQAFVWWHMAAMGGNVEAAMALAHRLSELPIEGAGSATTATTATTAAEALAAGEMAQCWQVLPYYEAAAHGVMDQLEASSHSRAKILPHMDLHMLAQVHMHGGTSSQLAWYNKPDESKEAIQFYHLKATTTPWSSRLLFHHRRRNKETEEAKADDDDDDDSISTSPPIDVHAAYTLAHLYHYGVRGVEQNLTQALVYYEIAGTHGHWESAGQAGTLHFWGVGVPQDSVEAWTFFRLGAPYGLEGCRRHQEQALLKAQTDADESLFGEIHECDDTSLAGLGLAHLLGIPGKVQVDLVTAEKYFTLAKEMGNADAMYNLAMMWLGWKTHYKYFEDLQDDGMSDAQQAVFPGSEDTVEASAGGSRRNQHNKPAPNFALHYSKRSFTDKFYKGPVQSEIQDSIKLLTMSANKGHVQAKHRLGLIYSEGISIQTAALKYDAIKPDCFKARAMFQWMAEKANPSRALRLRRGYEDYTAGDWEASLRNYLAAAETGSNIGQVNAAFLLERGICLGLAPSDCAKASVRLWKAAAARGNAEAFLRVGDFYYYGRLRSKTLPAGPFGWVQYLLFPEEHLPALLQDLAGRLWSYMGDESSILKDEPPSEDEVKHEQELVDADLAMAAHYYTEAVEKHNSPRANFNLGFMHEWGLGLKQDFPLAKRHYDLATTSGDNNEAGLAVQIALMAMSSHEYFVKWQVFWDDWWNNRPSEPSPGPSAAGESLSPKATQSSTTGQPVPGTSGRSSHKTPYDIIMSHIFNWSSFVIVVLLYVVVQLMNIRERRRAR